MHRDKVRQVSLYANPEFLRRIEKEARERHRKLGPTVAEILREYFEKKDREARLEKAS